MGNYLIQKEGQTAIDPEIQFKGLRIQSVKGLGEVGAATNIYTERWIGSNISDVFIPVDNLGNPTISYAPIDVVITLFITNRTGDIDVQSVKNAFINYIQGAIYFIDNFRGLKSKLIFMGSVSNTMEMYGKGTVDHIQFSCKFEKINSIDEIV